MPGSDHLRGHLGLRLAAAAAGVRVGLAHRLPALRPVEPGQGVGQAPPGRPRRSRCAGRVGLVAVRDRFGQRPGGKKGAPDWTESDRPWQGRIENPPHHRSERRAAVAGHLRREHARQPWPAAARARDSAHPAPAVDRAAGVPPSSTPARATTTTTCGNGFVSVASATASPARASSLPSDWADTAGLSKERSPGWPVAAACTAATNARPNTSSPSSA